MEAAFKHPNEEVRKKLLEVIKKQLHLNFVVKPEEISDKYFESREEYNLEHGIYDERDEDQIIEDIISGQEGSLDTWLNYLISDDAHYPNYLKYWILMSVTKIAPYDPERQQFPKRSKGTVATFPELNPEALSLTCAIIERNEEGNLAALSERFPEVTELVKTASFRTLYAYAYERIVRAKFERSEETAGEWIIYRQNPNQESEETYPEAVKLFDSIEGKGTGWCTAGDLSTAEDHLNEGDFHVYYTYDSDKQPTIPRVAVRMSGRSIAEVRGIDPGQELESQFLNIARDHYLTLPGGENYHWKATCVERLATIRSKVAEHQDPTPDELFFMLGGDGEIETFSYNENGDYTSDFISKINRECFNEGLARRLIDASQTGSVIAKLEYFDELTMETVSELMRQHKLKEGWFRYEFIQNITKYKHLHTQIAELLIELGGTEQLLEHLDLFDNLTWGEVELLEKLYAKEDFEAIEKYMRIIKIDDIMGEDSDDSSGLDPERIRLYSPLITQFFETRIESNPRLLSILEDNLLYFTNLSQKTAETMLRNGHIKLLAEYLITFSDLDIEIATTLIKAGFFKEIYRIEGVHSFNSEAQYILIQEMEEREEQQDAKKKEDDFFRRAGFGGLYDEDLSDSEDLTDFDFDNEF